MRGGIRLYRALAAVLALAVLGWQVRNALAGAFVHEFLGADLVVGLALLVAAAWPGERGPAAALLAGFAALAGVFLAATTGRLLLGEPYTLGTALTTVGLVPCLIGVVGLGRRLAVTSRSDW